MPQKQELLAFAAILAVSAFLASAVFAATLEVDVKEIVGSETKAISTDSPNNILKASYDVLNSGSAAYGARMRMDIFNGTEQTATIWSNEESMAPGERKTIDLYWFSPSESSRFRAVTRLYRAYEIVGVGNISKNFSKSDAPNNIEISRIHSYGNKIIFRIKSPADAQKIIVYAAKGPEAWLFEENAVENVKAGESRTASINYETGAFSENGISIMAAASDGKNYGTENFVVVKQEGIEKWLNEIADWLGA